METDMLVANNGQVAAQGSVAATLLKNKFDPGALRPYISDDGQNRSLVTINSNVGGVMKPRTMVYNADATLRKNDWLLIDQAVILAAKPRLNLFGDLRAAGLSMTIPQGMGKTVLESQSMSDISEASLSMDGRRKSNNDRMEFGLVGLPLVIAHKEFSFGAREIEVSRNTNTPLDTSGAELASRRVAEAVERLTTGELGYAYASYNVYGYATYPGRITKTITAPTAGGWTPSTTVNEVLSMRQLSVNQFHRGPWMLYTALSWDQYLDEDYILTGGNVATQTLRQRLQSIKGITDVRTADYLNGYDMVLVQFTSDVVRGVVGMEMVTVQWMSQDGMEFNFKVMCIMVPQIRSDFNGNTGIVHGSVSSQTNTVINMPNN